MADKEIVEDKNKAEEFGWDTNFDNPPKGKGNNEKKTEWMDFKKPGSYTVRLVGKGVEFLKYGFKPFGKGARIITHASYKDEDPAWLAGFYPQRTFAIHVIDRADGKLKVMEKGKTLFKAFAEYMKVNEINPAGKNGPDWVIKVEGMGLERTYTATAKAKPSPFTEEEIAMIKESLSPLTKIYKATSLEKIQEAWEKLDDTSKTPPPKKDKDDKKTPTAGNVSTKPSTPIEEPEVEAEQEPVIESEKEEEDDLFDKDDSKTDTPF
jgi:hypothetical protein